MFPLRVRSYFSLLKGTASPAAICSHARSLGYDRLALTDDMNLYGLWDFLAACDREKIRPIVGVELPGDESQNLTLLVEDDTGYTNLCNWVARATTVVALRACSRIAS